jgi:HEAT repeat protein
MKTTTLAIFLALAFVTAGPAFAQPAAAGRSVDELIAAAGAETEIAKRGSLYRELGNARDTAAAAFLSRAALRDAAPGARIDAVQALRKIGGPEALNGLLEALAAEKHKGVRIQVLNSLGFFTAPQALAKLRETAKSDPDKDLRISAVMALSRLNDTETLAAGYDAETDPAVKIGMIDALGRAEGGEKELAKIKARNKNTKIAERLDLYTEKKAKKR